MQILNKKFSIIIIFFIIIIGLFIFYKKNSMQQMMKGERIVLNKLVVQNRAIPEDYIELGTVNILIDKKNFKYGIEMMKSGFEKSGGNPNFLIRIGEMYIYYNKSEIEKGFEYLKRAEKILDEGNFKSKPKNYAYLGELWRGLKKYKDSLRTFRKAISLQKDDIVYLDENNFVNDPTFIKYLNDAIKEIENKIK